MSPACCFVFTCAANMIPTTPKGRQQSKVTNIASTSQFSLNGPFGPGGAMFKFSMMLVLVLEFSKHKYNKQILIRNSKQDSFFTPLSTKNAHSFLGWIIKRNATNRC